MESNLLTEESWDFSEEHLTDNHGFDYHCCNNDGNMFMSMAYLARWTGPINESDDPYDDEDACGNSPTGLTVQKHTQKVYQLPPRSSATDNDAIKNAIMTHGGVFASMRWDSSCYPYNDSYLLNGLDRIKYF
jgi:C1A family cysteine protease